MIRKLVEDCEKLRLGINTMKTQYMRIGNDYVYDITADVGVIQKTIEYN